MSTSPNRRRNSQVRRALTTATFTVAVACFISSANAAWASLSGGTQRWAASYHFGGPAFSFAVGVTPDGSTVFVSGTTIYGSNRPGHNATLAYDASTGAEKWVATYTSSSNPDQRDRATRLAVSPDGSEVFVTGDSACYTFGCIGSSFTGYSTVAYDASTGTQLWVARYAVDGGAYSIAVSPDGSKVFVNGHEDGGRASATVAYDASTGAELWVGHSNDSPVYWSALAVSPDSATVFVAGNAEHMPCGYHTSAYDASDGTQRWSALYPDCGAATALAASPDGSTLFLTGYDDLGAATVAYDTSNGTQLWAAHEDQIHVLYGDTIVDLAVSPDGSKLFVSGYDCNVYPCPDQPFATVAYDASTGDRSWASRYRSGGRNYLTDVGVSSDGSRVFVTGQEQLPCYSPCTTSQVNAPLVAYDASTGNELWVADYENNSAWALAVSPDGSNVYLAGTFTTSTATSSAANARADRLSGAISSTSSCSPCGYSTAAYNTGPGPGTSQDRDPFLSYNGWRNLFDQTALGGAYRASRVRGDLARYRTPKTRSLAWLTHFGPNQGRARVRIDGHNKGTVDLYRPTASAGSFTFAGLSLAPHLVEVKVLGIKDASSKATWVAVDGFKVGGNIRAESSPRVRYDTWVGTSKPAASGGSYRRSGSSVARVSFAFAGRSIAWVTATGPAYGRAKVVIDGVAHTVDLYRRTQNWRTRIWYTGLSSGPHHITLRPLGAKHPASTSTNIVFDAFVVRS